MITDLRWDIVYDLLIIMTQLFSTFNQFLDKGIVLNYYTDGQEFLRYMLISDLVIMAVRIKLQLSAMK